MTLILTKKAEEKSSAFFIPKSRSKNGQVQHRYNILVFLRQHLY